MYKYERKGRRGKKNHEKKEIKLDRLLDQV